MKITDMSVMIMEDDDFQRDVVVGMLASLGVASVLSASNGKQALDIILGPNSESIDVVLCDLNMPEMDGMEFLRHLGAGCQNIAVILISALDSKLLASVGRMTQLYGIQLLGVIEKPVLLENLREYLLKRHPTTRKAPQAPAKSFTLDEILQGIHADQFEPFFQPKVDMKTGRLTGAEALARWIHPDHGVIGPYAFIPVLEQTGNIDDLTFRMLRKSVAALRAFHEKGYFLTVSVNLSLVSLDDTSLAEKITQTARELAVDPKFIVLEITESAAMTDVAPALENLARLCMNGFALSIDDYGTGSSNIQQLTRIAFSELKIDQSFVKDFWDHKALRIVVESSIDMAHKLLVKSVAEGVETQRDWDGLKVAGCDTAQGYFIARPMDVMAFQKFVADFAPI
ncbi:MAG: EAL domain-containing response regulator [Gallionella sp.]|jgi:EAL domain-containing protein (putative c-di-GMP-specific phosphodiesterase class I)